LPALVGLLDRAARRVARRFSGAVLSVGDLSRREGGGLFRHRSHESGRDADVGFYYRGANDKAVLPDQFLAVANSGKTTAMPGAIFDDARNWALVEALIDDPETHVSYVFVASHLRARLLRFAEAFRVAPELRERAAAVMMQPRHALPHDDHFHIRISCPEEQQGVCIEDAVLHSTKAKPPLVRARSRIGSDGQSPSARPSEIAPRGPEVGATALLPARLEH
jgi:penicillin-insensitive murein endopeptidase